MAEPSTYIINSEYKWFAVYTRLNHEKKVEESLKEKNIEVFLPKKKTIRKWSDRAKWIEEPLFRPYVFVNVSHKEYYKVLQTPSVISYICFDGKAAPINDKEIMFIKALVNEPVAYEVINANYMLSQKVIVTAGPFKDFIGVVIKEKDKTKFVVRIEQVNYLISLEINSQFIEPI
jgi:transcription antitermination factor NusG